MASGACLVGENETDKDQEVEGFDEDYALSDDDLSALGSEGETGEDAEAEGLDEDYALSDDDLSALLEAAPLEEAAPAGEDETPENEDK